MERGTKQGSKADWALITESVTAARVEVHRLWHLINRGQKLVETSTHRDHLFQVAGDLIAAVPGRMKQLERDLDRASYALSLIGADQLKKVLPLADRNHVTDGLHSNQYVSRPKKASPERVAGRYLAELALRNAKK